MSNSVATRFILLVLLAFAAVFYAANARAGCAAYAQNGSVTDGYYLDNACTAIINNYSPCKVVTNSTGAQLFVPSYYPAATSTIGQAEWNSFLAHPPAGVSVASCSCTLPWGGSLAPGQSATAYQSNPVACHGSCTSQTRTCTCSDSSSLCVLSGSYTNQSCSVTACLPCSLPWGGSINDGQSATAFSTSTVACGSTCTSQSRSCNNGALSGSYTKQTCTVDPCPCTLPWGGSIASGSNVTAYNYDSEACGGSCGGTNQQTRICSNGSLSGTYTNQSCAVDPCGCSATGYSWNTHCSGTVAAKSSGQSETVANTASGYTGSVTASCSNGTWGYSGASCTANGCSLPWGGSISSGSSTTAYQAASVPYGSSCVSQTRTCTAGSLSGSYANKTCTVQPPASCSATSHTWNTHCSGSVASKSSGGSETVSNTASGYTGSITASCSNGSWSYSGASCTASSCSLPWGGTLANGSSVTAYQAASVPYGSSCVSQTRTCTAGSLSGSYANKTCTVQPPASCTLPWGGSLASGSSVTAYKTAHTLGSNPCVSETRSCSNGSLSGSYTFQTCTPGSGLPGCTSCPSGWYPSGGGCACSCSPDIIACPAL